MSNALIALLKAIGVACLCMIGFAALIGLMVVAGHLFGLWGLAGLVFIAAVLRLWLEFL